MVTGKGCAVGCVDAGYADTEELEKIGRRGTKVIVPSQRQACALHADMAGICKQCKHYGECTKAQRGRKIVRLAHEEVKEKLERHYEQPGVWEDICEAQDTC